MPIELDPHNPYPLPPPGSTYADAQLHAEQVDRWLGFRIDEIEKDLAELGSGDRFPDEQRWIGLKAQALLTPYVELRQVLEDLNPRPQERLLDLGAGYGRMGLVLARHFPEARFLGLEIVAERVAEGNRVLAAQGALHALLRHEDLASPRFSPPRAEYYFLYDYGTRAAIEKTLQDLRALAVQGVPLVVVGRGRATRDAIERRHPWLASVISPLHRGNYSIYRSA